MTAPAPLSGLLVLDFSRVLAGPHCGRMLVDLGADVVKIEPPEGDLSRFNLPRIRSISLGHLQQNCGKRNISLDLRRPEAVDLLRELADRADIVLENFRPGVMDRMGLGYEELSRTNPRLVFASISGYGQTGPWAGRRAYAPLIHAEMGLLEGFARYRKLEPAQEPYSHADLYAGLHCLTGIITALYQRERTGRGQRVDVAMAQSMLCVNEFAATGLSGMRDQENPLPATVASPIFKTATGRLVTVGGDPTARANFRNCCTAMNRPDLLDDPRFADDVRRENRDELLAILQEWVGGFDDVEVLDKVLAEAGLVMGVLRSVVEAGETEWAAERGAVVEVDDGEGGTLRLPDSPWRFSEATSGVRGVGAYRGEHNREVLTELLGLSDDRIDALETAGVLSSRPPRTSRDSDQEETP